MSNKLNRKKGWLVNDCLTCIPGVRTFWHDLLDWFPGLEDKCNGYTDYSVLAEKIESILDVPDYIIRNGSYFRKLNIDVPTFCLVQDEPILSVEEVNGPLAEDVCSSCTKKAIWSGRAGANSSREYSFSCGNFPPRC